MDRATLRNDIESRLGIDCESYYDYYDFDNRITRVTRWSSVCERVAVAYNAAIIDTRRQAQFFDFHSAYAFFGVDVSLVANLASVNGEVAFHALRTLERIGLLKEG